MNPVEMQLAKLKMLNIKSVLELEMGGVMAATPHLEEFELPERSKDWIQHSDSVIDALNNFVPRDKFMTIGIKSPIGARIGKFENVMRFLELKINCALFQMRNLLAILR